MQCRCPCDHELCEQLGLMLSTRNMERIIIVCKHFECIEAGRRDDEVPTSGCS
jgi:hypothetical protein